MDSQARWLSVLGKLRVNRSQGLAPHKPLLLLVVLEMIENGDLKSPLLKLTPELAFRFSQFGTIVAHRRTQRMDIHAVLNSLIQKGFIRRSVGKARSLEILRMPQATVIGVIAIPRLGSVPAGNPITADENRAGEVFVEASIAGKDPCFALDVTGSSMIGADILDGDTLIVRHQPLAESGDIVVASVDGEVTVIRIGWNRY